ncbi:MAG: hypothetical protein JOY69_01790, partial [Candidatus Eremiobacteraeota bacterium]|nr:hypothetical protein [Candidatus Eremiobacteraeota bacterium]
GTRALFAAIREDSGGYERICFNVRPAWYPLETFTRFYLNGIPLQVIDNVDDSSCSLPGTLVAVDNDHPFDRTGFRILTQIKDVDGNPFAALRGYR